MEAYLNFLLVSSRPGPHWGFGGMTTKSLALVVQGDFPDSHIELNIHA